MNNVLLDFVTSLGIDLNSSYFSVRNVQGYLFVKYKRPAPSGFIETVSYAAKYNCVTNNYESLDVDLLKPNERKELAILLSNNDFSQSDIGILLNVSQALINKYIKEISL